jgi:hypothetical protein
MEKFDRVGNSKMRTPSSDEDIGLGAAMQVANRADRGDIGPYEDMNMNQAMALATLLEKSKLGEGPLVGYPDTQRNPPPSFFYNPIRSAGILGGVQGFADGGPVGGNDHRISPTPWNDPNRISRVTRKAEGETWADVYAREVQTYEDLKRAQEAAASQPLSATTRRGQSQEEFMRWITGGNSAISAARQRADIARQRSYYEDPTGVALPLTGGVAGAAGAPPSKFFSNPALTTPEGVGTGILGGGTTDFVVPSVAPEEAPAAAPPPGTDMTLIAPPSPPPPPPVSRADQVADEFLNELKASRMSKDEMRQTALLQAGLGMMAGTSPFFAVNVGQGGMAGLQAYQQAKAQNQALASEAYKSMMAARALGLDERRVAATEASAQAEIDYRNKLLKFNEDKLTKMLNADPRSRGLSSAQWNTINAYGKELIGAKTAAGETITIDDVKNIMRQLAGVAGEYAAGIEDAEPSARPRLSVADLEE